MKTIVAKLDAIAAELRARGLSVKVDARDNVRSGFKFAEYELKGVPVRLALGPRDLENGKERLATSCVIVFVALDGPDGKPTTVPAWEPRDQRDARLRDHVLTIAELSHAMEERVRESRS